MRQDNKRGEHKVITARNAGGVGVENFVEEVGMVF